MKQKLLLLLTALLTSASMWAKVGDTFTRSGMNYEVFDEFDNTARVIGYESWLYGDVEILDNVNGYVVTDIAASAFENCTGLTSVTIPNSVTSIGNYAFQGCSGLKSVSIPGSVETIGFYTFDNCTSLTSITIPEGVTTIAPCAFSNCTSLISVTIPSSMTAIFDGAFSGCI